MQPVVMTARKVTESVTSIGALTRAIPRSLAPIVAALELDGAEIVTMRDLDRLRAESGIKTETKMIAKRLRDLGWLLPTHQAGVWEFAPGAHAGPIGHGNPFRDVDAAMAGSPELDAAVCLTSALWAHGLLERAPDRPVVAVRPNAAVPKGLAASVRVVRFDWQLRPTLARGTPTHRAATILVHMAARPSDVTSWGAVLDILHDLVDRVDPHELETELSSRPAAVKTRLAYLVEGIAPRLAHDIAQPGHGKVWFGPRGPLKRHHQRFGVADTILPRAPMSLARDPRTP